MQTPKLPDDTRPLAIGLLLVVVLVVYFVGFHWWFVAPQFAIGKQMDELREQQARYAAIVGEKPEIEQRLDKVRQYESSNPAFLPESDSAGASAKLIQRVSDAVKARDPDAKSCRVERSSPVRASGDDEPYQSVSVQIRMSCDTQTATGVLYDLESGKPFLFIDKLMLYRRASFNRGQAKNNKLQVQFTVSGYLRQPGGKQ